LIFPHSVIPTGSALPRLTSMTLSSHCAKRPVHVIDDRIENALIVKVAAGKNYQQMQVAGQAVGRLYTI